jgi:tRNA(Ile)-lysidine synthase TilS/MesJ
MTEKNMAKTIDYSLWKQSHSTALEGLRDRKVFLLFSAGKDSSVCMDLLLKAGREFGFCFEAHAGAFPIHRYTASEKERINAYWKARGATIIWHDVGEDDAYLEGGVNPCVSCQEIRRRKLNAVLMSTVKDWSTLVLVVSYTLWDVVSYAAEYLLAGIFSESNGGVSQDPQKRFAETSQRFYPLLQMREGYWVFRPLIRFNGCDVRKTVEEEGIPILGIPCNFKDARPKRILEGYYEKMGLRFDYEEVFKFAKQTLGLADQYTYTAMEKERYLTKVF